MPQRRIGFHPKRDRSVISYDPCSRAGGIRVASPTRSEVERSGRAGLLACDESTGTVGTRLEANGMENTEEWRQKSARSRLEGRKEEAPLPIF